MIETSEKPIRVISTPDPKQDGGAPATFVHGAAVTPTQKDQDKFAAGNQERLRALQKRNREAMDQ